MTTRVPWLCNSCARYTGDDTCDAFPQGIPSAVLAGAAHFDPLPGDHELQYLPQEGNNKGLVAYLAFWYEIDPEE